MNKLKYQYEFTLNNIQYRMTLNGRAFAKYGKRWIRITNELFFNRYNERNNY